MLLSMVKTSGRLSSGDSVFENSSQKSWSDSMNATRSTGTAASPMASIRREASRFVAAAARSFAWYCCWAFCKSPDAISLKLPCSAARALADSSLKGAACWACAAIDNNIINMDT